MLQSHFNLTLKMKWSEIKLSQNKMDFYRPKHQR